MYQSKQTSPCSLLPQQRDFETLCSYGFRFSERTGYTASAERALARDGQME